MKILTWPDIKAIERNVQADPAFSMNTCPIDGGRLIPFFDTDSYDGHHSPSEGTSPETSPSDWIYQCELCNSTIPTTRIGDKIFIGEWIKENLAHMKSLIEEDRELIKNSPPGIKNKYKGVFTKGLSGSEILKSMPRLEGEMPPEEKYLSALCVLRNSILALRKYRERNPTYFL